jgi:hypothetical protein
MNLIRRYQLKKYDIASNSLINGRLFDEVTQSCFQNQDCETLHLN